MWNADIRSRCERNMILENERIRKSNIELLRIISMLLIISHHYVVNSEIMNAFQIGDTSINYIFLNLWGMWGKTCINTFILITGYFTCKTGPTIKRYCKILLEYLFYHFVIYFIMLAAGYETIGFKRVFDLFFVVFRFANRSGYFTYSFLIFYLFIPFINKFIQSITKYDMRKVVLLLLFVFTIQSTFFFNYYIFGEVFWFIAVYFIGAYLSLYPPEWSCNLKGSVRLLIMSLVLSYSSVLLMIFVGAMTQKADPYIFVADSNKLGAVLVSVMLFSTFKNLNIGYSKAINLMAKTTFGVLMIHANSDAWRKFMWVDLLHVNTFYSLPIISLIMRSILIVAGIFIICSLIDLIRIFLIEKPVFDRFDQIERLVKKAYEHAAHIGHSIYTGIIRIAER